MPQPSEIIYEYTTQHRKVVVEEILNARLRTAYRITYHQRPSGGANFVKLVPDRLTDRDEAIQKAQRWVGDHNSKGEKSNDK